MKTTLGLALIILFFWMATVFALNWALIVIEDKYYARKRRERGEIARECVINGVRYVECGDGYVHPSGQKCHGHD